MAYAENTSVPVEKSKAEIERILQCYGADQSISGWDALPELTKEQFIEMYTKHNKCLDIDPVNRIEFEHL